MSGSRETVLITNDDGIDAPGILALAQALAPFYDCVVAAPHQESSATSHGVTVRRSISYQEEKIDGVQAAYRIWGRPADCVKLALCELLSFRPDYLVSGINNGPNLGISVYYSGTVAAAREGAIAGIPSIAFSVDGRDFKDLEGAAAWSLKILQQMKSWVSAPKIYWNVNIPNKRKEAIEGVAFTKQAASHFGEFFSPVAETEEGRKAFMLGGELLVVEPDSRNDVGAVASNLISITPLQLDTTDNGLLERLKWE